jgi:serine/threonine protein kinase
MLTRITLLNRGEHAELLPDDVLPFQHIEDLGMGSSAIVEVVEENHSGLKFAHKIFRRRNGRTRKTFDEAFRNEVDIMKKLRSHPHIVQIHWSYTRRGHAGVLLTPVASNGDLAAYLDTIRETGKPPTSEQCSTLSRSFGCLASGLDFIHKFSIRHKDIKPHNILVHEGQMIFTDFGIAFDASGQDTTTTGVPGAFTARYRAPEVAEERPRNRKSDVFSLGCVFLEVIELLAPDANIETSDLRPYWQNASEIRDTLADLSTSGSVLSQMFLVCSFMLEPDSVRRYTAEAVLQHILSVQRSQTELPYELICKECQPPVSKEPQDDLVDKDEAPDEAEEPLDDAVERQSQYPSTFTPHVPERHMRLGKEVLIRTLAWRTINPIYRQAGYLYIFCDPRIPGFVNIGHTNNVPSLLKQWKKHCNRDFFEFDQQDGGERVLVPNAHRVETLVIHELMEVRFKEKCRGCGSVHIGWFHTTAEHAVKVIKKYSA